MEFTDFSLTVTTQFKSNWIKFTLTKKAYIGIGKLLAMISFKISKTLKKEEKRSECFNFNGQAG